MALAIAASGCTCRKEQPVTVDVPPPSDATPLPPATRTFELDLHRTALIAFGNSTPLPVSAEFQEEVPEVRPALERASAERPNAPLRMRVARDVPYGQLTRLMQAALGYRVMSWELHIEDASRTLQTVTVLPPGPTPRGSCWARAWVGPDERVQLGVDVLADAMAGMLGVLVVPKDGRLQANPVLDVLRRMDDRCATGQTRLYSQATARVGPVLDLARAIATATPPPHLRELLLQVPSIGPLDSPTELVK
ncbi:MAG: hypothetical protein HYV09_05295 [Deltaproteobacteria bacterium]|nr:hypothetical protein [Deltaproteobacteria bacterium]